MIDAIIGLGSMVAALACIIYLQEKKIDKQSKEINYYRNQANKWEYLYNNFCDAGPKEKPPTTEWVNMGGDK